MKDSISSLTKSSSQMREERWGRSISYFSIGLICLLVISMIYFVASKGILIFTRGHVNPIDFLFGTDWNPEKIINGKPMVGAWPMISTSFIVTILSAVLATPFAIAIALVMTELAPKWFIKWVQPLVELLVGIPSVVYGLLGLTIVVPFVRTFFGGTGFGILSGVIVLTFMVFPTVTSLSIDSLQSVPQYYRNASAALGATQWQTIWHVVLRTAAPGLLTAVIFGMTRAFGEALAVQMVIGNITKVPLSITSPGATLTSVLTTGIGNTILGTFPNNALWSLALVLMIMSLIFNLLIRLINHKRG